MSVNLGWVDTDLNGAKTSVAVGPCGPLERFPSRVLPREQPWFCAFCFYPGKYQEQQQGNILLCPPCPGEPPPTPLLVSSKSWVKCFHQLLVGLSCKCGTTLDIAPGSVFRVWWICFVTPKLCPPSVFSLAWPIQRELTEPVPALQPAASFQSSRCFNCPLLYCEGLLACTCVLECICMCNPL